MINFIILLLLASSIIQGVLLVRAVFYFLNKNDQINAALSAINIDLVDMDEDLEILCDAHPELQEEELDASDEPVDQVQMDSQAS